MLKLIIDLKLSDFNQEIYTYKQWQLLINASNLISLTEEIEKKKDIIDDVLFSTTT